MKNDLETVREQIARTHLMSVSCQTCLTARTHVGGCSAEVVGHVIESFAEDGQAEIGDFDVEMIVGI